MPLLKRKAFEKSTVSEYLRDDDEVFHCEVTDEIFKDYEEYCERIILVNSMVWTCEMTGKNNLTYAEALESEKAARRSLKDFPMELRIPILFLAAKTKRCGFAEMSEDVFSFVRERYFVGETVEACLENDIWKEAHILTVIAQKQPPGSILTPPASSYCYEVEQFDQSDASTTGQIGTVAHDRIRRRKGVYSRDKNKLFLKQFVEQGLGGVFCIKKSALEKYNIAKVNFDQLFTGYPPEFPSSKKLIRTGISPSTSKILPKTGSATKKKLLKKPTPEKKGRQESMDKFLKKTDKAEVPKPKPPADPAVKKSAQELAEKMRRAEDLMKQKREDEKAQKKEKTARLHAYLKEWQKVKDDLELEDHKIIPKGTPVEIEGIPHNHFGDYLSVLEFVYIYADILKTKDVFHSELDIETFRKALTLKEHAGTFSDLIQMFLTAIFSLQEDEAEEYNEKGGIEEFAGEKEADSGQATDKAIDLATKASKWSQTYLGTPLSKLPLDPTTVTEVLRLHILSSGATHGGRAATWRYQQRGGYTGADDAGLRLRLQHPDLLRRLSMRHVADLSLGDKFVILQCLMNQILSYATVRDVIEEKIEEYKNTRHSLRMLHANERKRDAQVAASRQELKKEFLAKKEEQKLTGDAAKQLDEELKVAIENLMKESEVKRQEYEKKYKEMQTELFDYASYLGSDRAYRRYWVNQKVAGLFVEAGDEPRGLCLDKLVRPRQREGDTLAYVARLFEAQKETVNNKIAIVVLNKLSEKETAGKNMHRSHMENKQQNTEKAGSDKENDSGPNSRGNSPKKPFNNLNGLTHKLNGLESNLQQLRDLLVCTGDSSTCFVHGKGDFRPHWSVYHTPEQLEGLIQSLNKRGAREAELRQALETDKHNILEYMKKCPVHLLNSSAAPPPPTVATRHKKFQLSLEVPTDCSLSEALELSLRDHILELEEKIFHGCLGGIKVKDREAWRGTIMLRSYDKQADFLTWGPHKQYRDEHRIIPNGVLNSSDDTKSDIKPIPEHKYRDPGYYLEAPKVNGVKLEPDDAADKPEVVRALASALLQVSQGIHHKYLRRPLGLDEKERKEREAKNKPLDLDALERWEVSLMESRSFSQIVLHLFTFDSSVMWSASILNASCRVCRRKTDPDNMLLCDGCNKGHHLYCLKPKLTKVPAGDWFCEQCKPKERTPRKRRKLYTEEKIKKVLEESGSESEDSFDTGVCGSCGSGGRLAATCAVCAARYHTECAEPKPGRAARKWTCIACLAPVREIRRCAATAMNNIHQYARALDSRRNSSESYDSDDNVTLGKLKGGKTRDSKESSPLLNWSLSKKSRRSKDEINTSATKKSKTSLTNGVHEESRKSKKRNSRPEPLHTEAVEQLVRDVMRHKDCWPFYEPVDLDEVPDYLNVIEEPMDMTTIKQKLESGGYSTDGDLIADIALVLTNCFIYNQDTHPVAKAGVRLEKYINKRCSELELPSLPEIITQPEGRSNKRSPSKDLELPKGKKPKQK